MWKVNWVRWASLLAGSAILLDTSGCSSWLLGLSGVGAIVSGVYTIIQAAN